MFEISTQNLWMWFIWFVKKKLMGALNLNIFERNFKFKLIERELNDENT